MNRFEEELRNNNFICSECLKCNKVVWPPSDYCNRCFGSVSWRKISRDAVLLEYSVKDGEYFCLAELEGQIRIMGAVRKSGKLKVGQKLILEKCDFYGNEKFIFKAVE